MRGTHTNRGERGMALVVALLVLLVLSMLALVMMASVSVNRHVAGIDMQRRKALDNAEAGIGEALMRIRNKDVGMVVTNPRATAQIYLALAGSIPVVGTDTTAMGTAQPTGNWLAYSTATKTPNVLTITYKTDPGRTGIYRYDPTQTPQIHFGGTGLPIYEITSTGTAGGTKRTVVTDVASKPVIVNAKGAFAAGMDVNFTGTAAVCGYDHSADTPPDSIGEKGRGSAPDCQPWEVGPGLAGAWSAGGISISGAALTKTEMNGSPDTLSNQTGFYNGPWDMLNMSQSDFASFIGAPQPAPTNIKGLVYVDNDLVMGNQSASAAFHNATGEGMLYVDGDLTLNAGFVYVGLIYVEGNLQLNGTAWILGGLVVHGKTNVTMNGNATVLYSSDAITQKLSQYGGQFTTLSWREK